MVEDYDASKLMFNMWRRKIEERDGGEAIYGSSGSKTKRH